MSGNESDGDKTKPAKKLKKYSLVQFVHRGPKRKVESIDIVPSKWLALKSKKCVTKYMGPPYEGEDLKLLNRLIELDADAPEDWPTYSVVVKGAAKDHAEALRKIQDLTVKEHVWSLESEESASEVQQEVINTVKRTKLLDDAAKMRSKFSAEKIGESSKPPQPSVSKEEAATLSRSEPGPSNRSLQYDPDLDVNSVPIEEPATISRPEPDPSNRSPQYYPDLDVNSVPIENGNTDMLDPLSVDSESNLKSADVDKEIADLLDATFLDMNNIKCTSEFQTAVIASLMQLKIDFTEMKSTQEKLLSAVSNIQERLDDMNNFLIDKKVINSNTEANLEKKYNVNLPLSSMDDFNEFDEKLKSNNFLKNDIYKQLFDCMDKDLSITRSMVKMLKIILTKDLALKFTAVRTSITDKSKVKFKNTEICKLIDAIITRARTKKSFATTPEDLISSLSDVLTNVKRWTA